ncbi:hypothetical protein [Mesotoga sp.]|uniref:hypothetical protein n=1 Tax=Mesotoga sp. TaxID=2053577 RepID=UPI00345ED781
MSLSTMERYLPVYWKNSAKTRLQDGRKLKKTLSLLLQGTPLREQSQVFSGKLETNLVFSPNPLFPELVSLGAAG